MFRVSFLFFPVELIHMAIDLIGFLRCCFLNVDPFHAETHKHTRTHKKQWRNAFKVISHFSSLPLFAYPCWKCLPQPASCGECLFVVREAVWRKKKADLQLITCSIADPWSGPLYLISLQLLRLHYRLIPSACVIPSMCFLGHQCSCVT